MRVTMRHCAAMVVAVGLVATACGGSGSSTTAPATMDPVSTASSTGTSPTGTGASLGHPAKPSSGCGASKVGAVAAEKHTVAIAGVERWYLRTTPEQHDGTTPLPLVFDFHGLAEGAEIHSKMTGLADLAQAEGFVAVMPQGTGQPVRWDVRPGPDNPDLAFFDAMVDELGAQLCIDTSRIYSTGLSYGAIMTSFLLCARSDELAAVAPVAGLQVPEECDQKRSVPILTFHGTADPILPFNGGPPNLSFMTPGGATGPTTTLPPADLNGPGYPEAVAEWATRNGCGPMPKETRVGTSIIHRVYDCPAATPVEFFIVEGGGHSWPGSEFSKSIGSIVGPTTFEIDASKEAWAFLQRFQLPA